jgi:two-component system cell cycle response regulator
LTARVLIVDDIPTNVRLLEARLSAEYFEVATASSGPEALVLCERGDIDIVLLDVMMPEMDGFEAIRRIRQMPHTTDVPIIAVTAMDGARELALHAGANDYMRKPIEIRRLIGIVNGWLSREAV